MNTHCRIGRVRTKLEIITPILTEPEQNLQIDYNYLMECDIEAYALFATMDGHTSASYFFEGMSGEEFYEIACQSLREQLVEDGYIQSK